MTGEIEKTDNTFTVHHFVAQYHTGKRCAARDRELRMNKKFGPDSPVAWVLISALRFIRRTRKHGLSSAVRYYFKKYFKRG
jgi:hypothetical protein